MVLFKVNRYLCKWNVIRQFLRHTHDVPSKVLHPLDSRKLLKVSGSDSSLFLQGLITNDMRHFDDGMKSMYAMFLNNKGRVLYDTIIYKWSGEDNTFMLECDKSILNMLHKYLKLFILKRKVVLEDVENKFNLWALVAPAAPPPGSDPKNEINIYKDPRLMDLGFRVITSENISGPLINAFVNDDGISIKLNDHEYKYLRYKLGVSEGPDDLPSGACLPLEANCDYLHGVSFHKGCYIGQELTARVYHTGVVRKRIMPIKFTESVVEDIEKDSNISDKDAPKSNLGKLRVYSKDFGLGLVRVKEAMKANSLLIKNHTVEVLKPKWWPIEAPREVTAITNKEE